MHTKQDNKFLGNYGERVALQYLQSIGMQVIKTNYTFHRQRKNKGYFDTNNRGAILG